MNNEEVVSRVRKYAKLLGVNDKVDKIVIYDDREDTEEEGRTLIRYNMPECDLVLFDTGDDTIIHELLHVVFKNTYNGTAQINNEDFKNLWNMIHEQEIELLSRRLAKVFKNL